MSINAAIDEQLATPPWDPEKGRRRPAEILVSMCDRIKRKPKKRRRRRNRTRALYDSI
jgi:hypothetical protein